MNYPYEFGNLYYEKYGSGKKSIIILPGWGDIRTSWNYIIDFLKDDFTVYIVDYPGFGNSKFPDKDLTIYDYTDIIYNWIQSLEIKDPILIGHSFGGRIIITLTGYYHYPFKHIVLMDSAGIKPRKTLRSILRNSFYKALKKGRYLLPKKYRDKYLTKIFSIFASPDYRNLEDKMRPTFRNVISEDLRHYLEKINANTLIIWGNKDTSTPIQDATLMHQKIPDSELIILDKVGHFPYLERPNLICNILYEQFKEFIAK